jgi:hypothetical protein
MEMNLIPMPHGLDGTNVTIPGSFSEMDASSRCLNGLESTNGTSRDRYGDGYLVPMPHGLDGTNETSRDRYGDEPHPAASTVLKAQMGPSQDRYGDEPRPDASRVGRHK